MVGQRHRNNGMLPRKDAAKNDSSTSVFMEPKNFTKRTNYLSKPILIFVVLFLIAQITTARANVLTTTHSVRSGHLVPGNQDDASLPDQNYDVDMDNKHFNSDGVNKVVSGDIREDATSEYVSNTTQTIVNNGRVLHRKVRDDSPFTDPETCVLTEEELNEILEVLQDGEVNVNSPTSGDGNVISTEGNCNKVVKEIKTEILHLKQTLRELNSTNISVSRYDELKASYEVENRTLNMKIDDVTRNLNQKLARQVAEFNAKYHEMQKEMNVLLSQSEKNHKKYIESQIRLCISETKNKEYGAAAKTFLTLQNTERLHRILESLYAKHSENLKMIREFLKALPINIEHSTVACTFLHEIMKINNHLRHKEVLMLDQLIGETMHMPQFKNAANYSNLTTLSNLKREVESQIRHVLDTWSVDIGKGSYQDILRFVESPFINIRDYLGLLTQLSYNDDLRYTDKVWEFVKGFKSLSESGIAYEALLNALLANDELYGNTLLKLAYKVKKFMDSADFRLASFEDRNRFKSIKNHLPVTVRFLLWNRVCIKNAHFKEHLVFISGESILRLLKENGRSLLPTLSGIWRFLPNDEGSSFYIENADTKDCVALATETSESVPNLRTTHACKYPYQSNLWNITLSGDAEKIYIHSVHGLNAVHAGNASDDNDNFRDVFGDLKESREYEEFELDSC